jgi:type VI secretion system secreted protein VgrG
MQNNPAYEKHVRRSSSTRVAALTVFGLLAASCFATASVVSLGAADSFAVLGASTVTNAGATVVNGDLGVSPGTAVTGFGPGVVLNGSIHMNDAIAMQAHADAATAYGQLVGETLTTDLSGQNLGGMILMPGVYHFATTAVLSGILTLDTGGDPNAAFHFQIGTTLTTDPSSMITFLNGTSANVFWQVGTSATIGVDSVFSGTILADQSITVNSGATINGRAIAINGAVTLDTNTISTPVVPEPSTWFPGVLALALIGFTERRRIRRLLAPAS